MHSSDIAKAIEILDRGSVVGMPTETVYGLAARIDKPRGIETIFKVKERPFFDPLIVHISDLDQISKVVGYFPEVAQELAAKFWPGPLTLVLPRNPQLNPMITSGLETVGVRMPSHPVALELIRAVGEPLAAPSANKFGKTSPTKADHVRNEFKNEDIFVLEGGDSQIGIESTVLWVHSSDFKIQLSILRKGHILKTDIQSYLDSKLVRYEFVESLDKKHSPGHMKHHYMPAVPLILCLDPQKSRSELRLEIEHRLSELPDKIEEVSIVKPAGGIHRISELILDEDPSLATRRFYSQLRELSATNPDCILLYKQSSHGSERWEGLYDRIYKAASLIVP